MYDLHRQKKTLKLIDPEMTRVPFQTKKLKLRQITNFTHISNNDKQIETLSFFQVEYIYFNLNYIRN